MFLNPEFFFLFSCDTHHGSFHVAQCKRNAGTKKIRKENKNINIVPFSTYVRLHKAPTIYIACRSERGADSSLFNMHDAWDASYNIPVTTTPLRAKHTHTNKHFIVLLRQHSKGRRMHRWIYEWQHRQAFLIPYTLVV